MVQIWKKIEGRFFFMTNYSNLQSVTFDFFSQIKLYQKLRFMLKKAHARARCSNTVNISRELKSEALKTLPIFGPRA